MPRIESGDQRKCTAIFTAILPPFTAILPQFYRNFTPTLPQFYRNFTATFSGWGDRNPPPPRGVCACLRRTTAPHNRTAVPLFEALVQRSSEADPCGRRGSRHQALDLSQPITEFQLCHSPKRTKTLDRTFSTSAVCPTHSGRHLWSGVDNVLLGPLPNKYGALHTPSVAHALAAPATRCMFWR